jgi:cobalt-zinc-cadmium efflux system outer membrane protein
MFRNVLVAALASLGVAAHAHGQTVLTFEETISRAREQAGAVLVARARVAEADASALDAAARFRDNPIIEGAAGSRSGGGLRGTELEVGISQQFETGGQRAARIAAASAAIERQRAAVLEVARGVVIDAATAFLEGIAATDRLQVAEGADAIAREILNATERRYALGDIAAIDVNLARIDAARSAASLVAARADLTAAAGVLRAILRIPAGDAIELRGSLDLPPPPDVERLRGNIERRPEFTVLAAEVREAEAQTQLGRALRRPDVGLRAAYEREEADSIVLGGLTITLPAFQRGQGTVAAGVARASRARTEGTVAREFAAAELQTAYAVYEQRARLSDALQQEAAPYLLDNETLGRRSYEAGEMNLMDYLLIRRDAIETRVMLIDRRLEAARSRLAVDVIAGVIQ